MIALDSRLSLCASYARKGKRLADIGTDHAYLPARLCLDGICAGAIAADINPEPLSRGQKTIADCGLENMIQIRLSDGLKEIRPDEADDIVIAGMGGELIASILSACAWIRDASKNLILQPMTRHEALIGWLAENGFAIEEQGAVLDGGKYYTVMRVRYDGIPRGCDLYEASVGRLRPDDEASVGFLKKCLNKLKKQQIGDPSLAPVIERLEELLA